MKPQIATLFAAAAILAGCVSQSTDHVPTVDERSVPEIHAVSYQACAEQDVAFPAPMSDLQAGLPDGFAPIPFAGDKTGKTGTIVIWSDACRAGAVDATAQVAPGEMWGYLPVTVPSALQDANVSAYLVVLGAIIAEPSAAAMYHSWGISELNLTVGPVSVATLGDSSSPLRTATADGGDGNFSVAVSSSAAGLTGTFGGGRVRAFIVGGGQVVGAFDNVWSAYSAMTEQGHSTVQFQGPKETFMGLATTTSAYPGVGNVLSGINYSNQLVHLAAGTTASVQAPPPATPSAAAHHLKALVF
ncbi:MAG: hypothetical protein ABR562_05665 [Thermoplasmatota archaeon]